MNIKILVGGGMFCMFLGLALKANAQEAVVSPVKLQTQWEGSGKRILLLSSDPFDAYRMYSFHRPVFSARVSLAGVNHTTGLFCKWETAVEKKSGIAPRIRLGSLQYTEWMEGKKDLRFRYAR